MPQCKLASCKEPAVYNKRWGYKRYCHEHGHAYADKRDAALEARARMPDCESGISPSCAGKVSATRHTAGDAICHFCQEVLSEIEAEQAAEARAAKRERVKLEALNEAKTVEDLRVWIARFLL